MPRTFDGTIPQRLRPHHRKRMASRAALCVLLLLPAEVRAHGWVTSPVSKNELAFQKYQYVRANGCRGSRNIRLDLGWLVLDGLLDVT